MTEHLAARVTSDPRIMMGKPVIEGTRIPVELILPHLAAGDSERQILADHPRLTRSRPTLPRRSINDIREEQAP